VLSITAGVHAYEFPPILAAQQLLSRIDPATLRGTVILVTVAHVPAFEHRVPYVNPFDRKNLSRVFPGDPSGTQAERIAWVLTTEVIRRGDMHLDIHGGDGAEWLEPFVTVYGGRVAAAHYPQSRAMGLALRFRNVVKNAIDDRRVLDSGRSVTRQAIADGKPTALIESGENGRRHARYVTPIVDGVENLLRSLRMIPGAPRPPRTDTRWFDGSVNVAATQSGIFTPAATSARRVRVGDVLGEVQDYAGRTAEVLRAPIDGYVLYGLTGPPVRAGDPVVNIGRPSRAPL
jgi:predicted deacylase